MYAMYLQIYIEVYGVCMYECSMYINIHDLFCQLHAQHRCALEGKASLKSAFMACHDHHFLEM